MEEKKSPPPIVAEKIHLQRIDVVQNRLDMALFKACKKPAITLGHKLMHNLAENRIKLDLMFSFRDPKEEELWLLQLDFHFLVDNLADFYKLDEKQQPIFFGPAIGTFLAIAVSTSRGIIFEKLESTGLKGVIIPVLDPHKLLHNSQ